MIQTASVEKGVMYGDQVGVSLIKGGEINTCNRGLCVYERVWMSELIVSREFHWRQHGNGTVDPDLSFGDGEESIGKRLGMDRCYIVGTRMIECGVDGLSRGDKSEGISQV